MDPLTMAMMAMQIFGSMQGTPPAAAATGGPGPSTVSTPPGTENEPFDLESMYGTGDYRKERFKQAPMAATGDVLEDYGGKIRSSIMENPEVARALLEMATGRAPPASAPATNLSSGYTMPTNPYALARKRAMDRLRRRQAG